MNNTQNNKKYIFLAGEHFYLREHFEKIDGVYYEVGWFFEDKYNPQVTHICKEAGITGLIERELPALNLDSLRRKANIEELDNERDQLTQIIELSLEILGIEYPDLKKFDDKDLKIFTLENKIENKNPLYADLIKYISLNKDIDKIKKEDLAANIKLPDAYQLNPNSFEIYFIEEIAKDSKNYLLDDAPELKHLITTDDGRMFLQKGIVGAVVGAGGIGKTQLLLQLTLSAATGTKFLNKYNINKGYVFVALGEEGNGPRELKYDSDLHWLIRNAAVGGGYSDDQLKEAVKYMAVKSYRGMHDLSFIDGKDENSKPSLAFENFKNELIRKEPAEGWSLIIIDPISRFLGPHVETNNAAGTKFVALLEQLTMLKGNPTVLFGHHMNKASSHKDVKSDQTAARGSSSIPAGARWQLNMDKISNPTDNADETLVRIHISKANRTAPFSQVIKKNDRGIPHDFQKSYEELEIIKKQQDALESASSRQGNKGHKFAAATTSRKPDTRAAAAGDSNNDLETIEF